MNLTPIIARLAAQCPAFRQIGGVGEYDNAVNGLTVAPAAFVLPLSDSAGDNYLVGVTAQRVDVRFGVIIGLRDFKSPASGESALNNLDALRSEVRAALHGWQPTADAEPCLMESGAVFDFMPGEFWWQDVYRTAHDVRTTQS